MRSIRSPAGRMLRHETPSSSRHASFDRVTKSERIREMYSVLNNIRELINDKRGVTALEYGLIAALIAVGIIGSVTALGTALTNQFNNIAAAL